MFAMFPDVVAMQNMKNTGYGGVDRRITSVEGFGSPVAYLMPIYATQELFKVECWVAKFDRYNLDSWQGSYICCWRDLWS